MPQGVGIQVEGTKATQPRFGFGSAGREHVSKVFVSEEHNKSLHGIESPGPFMYRRDPSIGAQHLSQKDNGPKWVFPTADRFKYDHVKRSDAAPGAGAYSLGSALGPQASSAMESAPMAGFGKADRETVSKIYISQEHVSQIPP